MTHGEFDTYGCSFCAKSQKQVRRMILGPDVAICDECVAIAVEDFDEALGEDWRVQSDPDRGGFG
jgi:ATP-dependent Clp protease ATP-binding subunit ClpX